MSKPRTLLFVENSAEMGGGNVSLLLILDHLDRAQYRPLVLCPAEGQMTRELKARSIPFRVLERPLPSRFWPFPFLKAVRQHLRFLREERPALVHVNDTAAYLWVGAAFKRERVPSVCHVRYPYSEGGLAYLARYTRQPDHLVYNSHVMETELAPLAERYFPGTRRLVLHNALDTVHFAPVDTVEADRELLGIEAGQRVVSMVANFTPAKDHETFLMMAREILSQHPGTIFILAGSDVLQGGRREAELRRHAEELGCAASVRFAGYVGDVRSILAVSDVVVCTSVVETFGRGVLEAMSCGRPVVASRVGGIPEVVSRPELGTLVDPGDVRGFTEAVLRFLNDQSQCAEVAANARRHAVENFGIESHMKYLHELYAELIEKGRREHGTG